MLNIFFFPKESLLIYLNQKACKSRTDVVNVQIEEEIGKMLKLYSTYTADVLVLPFFFFQ